MNILDQLADHARYRVSEDKKRIPPEEMEALAKKARDKDAVSSLSGKNRFLSALRKPGLSLICEIKRASPSKGMIAQDFPYGAIARAYEEAGADCISCLTEPKWFLGSDEIFREIRSLVGTPMLRKDFTVSRYQIYQAKAMGADAVLLICAILTPEELAEYLELCGELDLAALVETHDAGEIGMAVRAGARIIGVNNRNLRDFSVDFANVERLRDLIPPECVYVAESGVRGPEDTARLRTIGADAVLIGEMLMRAKDKQSLMASLREAAR